MLRACRFVLLFAERTLSYYKLKDARSMFDEVAPAACRLPRARRPSLAHTLLPLQMDADHSGKLDADEVATLCKKMGKKLNDKGLQAAMAEMDEDGGGAVDFHEFYAWWCSDKKVIIAGPVTDEVFCVVPW